jgi:hypothetical protein
MSTVTSTPSVASTASGSPAAASASKPASGSLASRADPQGPNALVARYLAIPRLVRWLLWFLLFAIVYLLVADPMASQYDSEASKLLGELSRRSSQRAALTRGAELVEIRAIAFGRPRPPLTGRDPEGRVGELLSVLRSRHALSERQRLAPTRSEMRLANSPKWITLQGTPRLDRLSITWSFESSTDALMATLTDLERSPLVHAITALEVNRPSGNRGPSEDQLNVSVTLESWVVPEGQTQPFAALDPAAKPAPAKPDAPKPDAPAPDAPKPDAPKADAPKADAPKPDAPKPDAPTPDAPKPDAPKPEAPKEGVS